MRMAELSRESGVPVATIKYYQREGLLPPGELTSPNQARYSAVHVRRPKLVRALLEIGDPGTSTHDILGLAQHGLPMVTQEVTEEDRAWALGRIEEVARKRGWEVHPGSRVVESLVGVLCALRRVGHEWVLDALDSYAESADAVAEADVTAVAKLGATEVVAEGAVVGTVLGDALQAALRRLAHAQASQRVFTV
ncbi:MerR family transcriptional regulator [Amycolatopsis endophytica]|uniref:DNA-binding transcriptional MerR regulator n=1 Tax=Amycolatopsis endophytica TaxID=860233 RepID=A0A853B671_9PSEU|nr:MerR family transcriptional regulator [Amycolatopsis endophytica]NYI90302.1 DNA-binding transcriptional MerR regulator [Amycolatopsis endophytica]